MPAAQARPAPAKTYWRGRRRRPLASPDLPWPPLASPGLPWPPLASPGPPGLAPGWWAVLGSRGWKSARVAPTLPPPPPAPRWINARAHLEKQAREARLASGDPADDYDE